VKLIIAGGREYYRYGPVLSNLKKLCSEYDITEVVCGKARGADTLGERAAKRLGIKVKYFDPNWDEFPDTAGCIRNLEMADYSDILLAFWDGFSTGTKHMIDNARYRGLIVIVIKYRR